MLSAGRRSWIIATIAVISSVLLLASVTPAFAASTTFEVQSVELQDMSTTASGDIIDFNETNISSDITFNKLNDSAKYVITLKNVSDEDCVIEGITDNNMSPYISYEYDSYVGETVKAGEEFVFEVTAKYLAYIADPSLGAQANSVTFRIAFGDGEEEIIINPNTSDNIYFGAVIIAISALIIIGLRALKQNKKSRSIIAVVAMAGIAVISAGIAEAKSVGVSEFALETNYILRTGRLIHYDGYYPDGGEMTDSYWTSDGLLKPNTYTAIGYHFAGWSLEPDGEKVYDDEERMINISDDDEPLTLYVIWAPNTYTVVFHANSDQATGSMEPITAEYDAYRDRLPYNEFILEGYRFLGWKKDNDGYLINDGAYSSQFEVENGATVDLYAQWELVPVGIDYFKNSIEATGDTGRQENFGASTKLRTSNYRREGYGFAGWNTEPDGTGILYGQNERVTMPEGGLKLYATWVKAEEDVTMQTFDSTAEPYASYSNGKVIALKDNRDNQVYTVAKLADGKWWMTENLRLVPIGIELTSDNTNNPTPAVQNITSSGRLCTENTVECINQFAYSASSLNATANSGSFAYGNGVYYNVYAATAGHAAVDMDNLVSEQVAGDICPKGWHLPTSGINGDFRTLDLSLGGTGQNITGDFEHAQKYYKAPISFVAGGWGEGPMAYRNIGSEAVYLERGTNGLAQDAAVFVDAAISFSGEATTKYSTHTIRCLAN